MKKSIVRAAISMMIALVLVACGGNGGSNAVDSITIDSLTPSTVVSSASTTFTISVSYNLHTKAGGIVKYGFKPDSSNSYSLEADQKIVSNGSGTALFVATKTLTGATTLRVQLAEYPTPQPYSPLVTASHAITVN